MGWGILRPVTYRNMPRLRLAISEGVGYSECRFVRPQLLVLWSRLVFIVFCGFGLRATFILQNFVGLRLLLKIYIYKVTFKALKISPQILLIQFS